MNWPILSVVTFLPLFGAVLVMLLVRGNERLARGTARWIALWSTLVTFAISLVMVWRFDASSAEFQFVEKYNWLGIASYHMERVVQIARETGYLEGVQDFRPMDAYGYLPPNKVVALCTGSQGEPRAALSRIAEDQHPEVTFSAGDRVIYSARTIPGNEKAVNRVINLLIEQGIEVITDRTHLVHVSGHPRRAELEELIGWVKPKVLIPVHGEALHLHEHAELARRCGVRDVVQCRNGDLVQLSPQARIVDEVPAGRIYKDGMEISSRVDG